MSDADLFRLIDELKLCLILRQDGQGYCADYRSGPTFIEACAGDLRTAVTECAAKVESARLRNWAE